MREPTRNIVHFQPHVLICPQAITPDRKHRRLWSRGIRSLLKERAMSKKQKRIFWPVVILAALGLGALAFASERNARKTIEARSLSSQNPPAVTNSRSEEYVRAGRLWPQLRWHLKTLGDRIEKPGKERITITGTIKRAGDSQALPMAVTLEFPDRLRLTVQDGLQQRVVTFNGQAANSVGNALTAREREFIETLVYDTAEHFFVGQTQGTAMRCLGQRFRTDDGTTPNYSGPYYNLYEVSDQIKTAPDARQQVKTFYFNSDTLLLEKVRYQIMRNGTAVEVETRISNWQQAQGQQLPRRIVRIENGQPVLALTITALAISSRVDDGSFGQQ